MQKEADGFTGRGGTRTILVEEKSDFVEEEQVPFSNMENARRLQPELPRTARVCQGEKALQCPSGEVSKILMSSNPGSGVEKILEKARYRDQVGNLGGRLTGRPSEARTRAWPIVSAQ